MSGAAVKYKGEERKDVQYRSTIQAEYQAMVGSRGSSSSSRGGLGGKQWGAVSTAVRVAAAAAEGECLVGQWS